MLFLEKDLREGNGNKHDLLVSHEGSDFSFLSTKSALAAEEVPTKGVT